MAGAYPFNGDPKLVNAGNKTEGTGLPGYFPNLYALKLRQEFYNKSVLSSVANVDYESQFKQKGDKIYIRRKPIVSVRDYDRSQDLKYDDLKSPEPIEMVIEHAKYWAFIEDPVTHVQTDIKSLKEEALQRERQAVQDAIEPDVINGVIKAFTTEAEYATILAQNSGATAGVKSKAYNLGTVTAPIDVTATTRSAINLLADIYGVLSEQNVFSGGERPFVLCPKKMLNVLAKSDLTAANFTGDAVGVVRRGQPAVGIVQNCDLYDTNYLDAVTGEGMTGNVFPVIAGTREAVSFAMQFNKIEELQSEKRFGTLHRGLSVYGYKLIVPEAFVLAYVRF